MPALRSGKKEDLKNILIAGLSYLSFLCIVPIFFRRNSEFVVFHAKQGLVLFGIEVATILLSIIPFIGLFVSPVIFKACVLLSLWGLLSALTNRQSRIILVSQLADKIHL